MRIFHKQVFEGYHDQPLLPWQRGRVFEDLEFRECQFRSAGISITANPRRRSLARHVRFLQCSAHAVTIYSLVAEDVLIDGLSTATVLQTWSSVFKHVTLRGRIGEIMLSNDLGTLWSLKNPKALTEANEAFYSDVDWAIDISEAEFTDADLRGVPGHLVRRDPATQALVTREKAKAGDWRSLDLSKTHWHVSLELLAMGGMASNVLVAPKRARNFARLLDGLKLLRDAGVAELD